MAVKLDYRDPRPVYGDRLGFFRAIGWALLAWAGIIALLLVMTTSN